MVDKDILINGCDTQSDLNVINNILSGNKEYFSILMEKYGEKIRNMIFFIMNDKASVDDIAQDVFIKAYESLTGFRNQSGFYTWLYKIALNRCRDEIRKKKIRKLLPVDYFLSHKIILSLMEFALFENGE